MNLEHNVFIKGSVPHIMDLIESFKESRLDHERGEEYAKKFEENKYFDAYFLSDI